VLSRSPLSLIALLAGAVVALAGCGGQADQEAQPPAATPASTLVTVVIRPKGETTGERGLVIRCPGDKRCDRLQDVDLSPTPPTTACAQVYGGPATALVTGRIGGKEVHATFDLRDSCAIARWERLSWLLGDPPKAS
jgi:hypothetical protein